MPEPAENNCACKYSLRVFSLKVKSEFAIKNKKLMASMWTLIITSAVFYVGILTLAVNTLEEGFLLGTIICVSTILFVIAGFIALKLEVDAGYYECKKCHHKFIPTYLKALVSMHMSTTRYMKCPKCGKWSWCKKTMSKE